MVNTFEVYINKNTNVVVMVLGKATSEPNNKDVIIYREFEGNTKITTLEYFEKNYILAKQLNFK